MNSMTGFGRAVQRVPGLGMLVVEIKTVNHRFFDITFRIPSFFSSLEIPARNILKKNITRGSVTVFIDFSRQDSNMFNVINIQKATMCYKILDKIRKDIGISQQPTLENVLSMPGVVTDTRYVPPEKTFSYFESAMKSAVVRLVKTREQEGRIIAKDIGTRVRLIKKHLDEIIKYVTEQVKKESVVSTSESGDTSRQAIGEMGEVTEEIVRLKAHIESVSKCIKQKGEVGKRLDFLAQELHREANTLGAKVQDIRIIKIVVDLKSEIEKIKEQVQNVE